MSATENKYHYIFVHGLSGWGSYDKAYRAVPYWGMFGGDLIKYLRKQDISCYAASVAPTGSAWDRACELYAQLSGSRTDYGTAHSTRCRHDRFGRDYSSDPLYPYWDNGDKIVLIGHSFGGATVRLFAELLANGDDEERKAAVSGDLSPLFAGGMENRIHAVVTLAAPTNGTTAYDLYRDPGFDPSSVPVPWSDRQQAKLFESRPSRSDDGRDSRDRASFDMHIDNALSLNGRISTLKSVYYLAVPCSATYKGKDGDWHPIRREMEGMFRKSSAVMGAYSGRSEGGFPLDDRWKENDGLVNTVSAGAPFGAPVAETDEIVRGKWNVLPVYRGDHMSLQGRMTVRNDIRPFYRDLIRMIDKL